MKTSSMSHETKTKQKRFVLQQNKHIPKDISFSFSHLLISGSSKPSRLLQPLKYTPKKFLIKNMFYFNVQRNAKRRQGAFACWGFDPLNTKRKALQEKPM